MFIACSDNSETDKVISTNPPDPDRHEITCIEGTPPYPAFDLEADFNPWKTSPYILPYPTGNTYKVIQGNSSGFGHSGFWRYGYDFKMSIGSEIIASRGGVVVHANDGTSDGNPNGTNLITIEHEDGTVALYSHLTLNGVFVNVGDSVIQGELIGKSGNTGNTGGIPHLHFSLHHCSGLPGLSGFSEECSSFPFTVRNTEPNPNGLGTGECYAAE